MKPVSHLQSFENRLHQFRARILQTASRVETGLYVFGPTATGKTHNIGTVLKELEYDYHIIKGRLSTVGLYDELESHQDSIIVLDDVNSILKPNHPALDFLLAAVGPPPVESRTKLTISHGPSNSPASCLFPPICR